MASVKEKNRQIVLLTLFAMILVVAGHSDITQDFKNLWIYKWAYSFHMPLFFFVSGFLFALTVPEAKLRIMSPRTFIEKKATRLIIPFLFINTVIFIIKATLITDSSLMQNPVELTWKSFLESTFFNPMGFMWFLPALFIIFMVAFLLRKLLININRGGYLSAVISTIIIFMIVDDAVPTISFMQISSAIHYITFFLLGLLYCDYKKQIDYWLKKYWIIISPVFFLISISLLCKGLVAAICGIIFSVTVALVIEDKCSDGFVKASGFCYTVFLLSYFPQMFIRGPVAHCFPDVNQYILSVISFLSGILFPVLVGVLFTRLKAQNRVINKCGVLIGL